MTSFRIEKDVLGEVKVPQGAYWGAVTQRSLENFTIGLEKMPQEIIYALVIIKKACAMVNWELKELTQEKRDIISKVADEILAGKFDTQFPLVVWQTGSGTQTNMNVNEVIANRANELLGGKLGSKSPIHPNDDVNKSQSSNDVFPTAMHIAACLMIHKHLIPALFSLKASLSDKAKAFHNIIKVGRTHLMDATPISLGQEFSGYAAQIANGIAAIENTLPHLREIALGGTAVGTGVNAPSGFSKRVAEVLSNLTGFIFTSAKNKFEAIATLDAVVESSGAIRRVACSLFKIANDIRWLASGPRCGLGELILPENEPGSSIMPGKVNPTQCEALTMVAVQVMGNDAAIGFAGSQGNFELNVFKPLIAYNFLQSIRLIFHAVDNFTKNCVIGIEANEKRIKEHLRDSLALAAALNPIVGYDQAAQIVRKAHAEEKSLKSAAFELGLLTPEQFDSLIDPRKMAFPHDNP